jgi:hypothetical protein
VLLRVLSDFEWKKKREPHAPGHQAHKGSRREPPTLCTFEPLETSSERKKAASSHQATKHTKFQPWHIKPRSTQSITKRTPSCSFEPLAPLSERKNSLGTPGHEANKVSQRAPSCSLEPLGPSSERKKESLTHQATKRTKVHEENPQLRAPSSP